MQCGSTTLKPAEELLGVSRSTIKRWLKRRRQTGDVNIYKIPGRPSVKGRALREWLPSHLKRNPDLTLREHCEDFEDGRGVQVYEATMSRNKARLPGERPLKKSRSCPKTAPRCFGGFGGGFGGGFAGGFGGGW